MKQLLPFLVTVSGHQPEATALLEANGDGLQEPLYISIKKVLKSNMAGWGSSAEDLPVVIMVYQASTWISVVWIFHHDRDELEAFFHRHGSVALSVDSGLKIAYKISVLPSTLPSCCLEVRWKKDEVDAGAILSKISNVCLSSGKVVACANRQTGSVIQFQTPETALEMLDRAKHTLATGVKKTSHTIRSITLNELTVIGCKWSTFSFIPSKDSRADQEVGCFSGAVSTIMALG